MSQLAMAKKDQKHKSTSHLAYGTSQSRKTMKLFLCFGIVHVSLSKQCSNFLFSPPSHFRIMDCGINTSSPPILCKWRATRPNVRIKRTVAFSSFCSANQQKFVSTTTVSLIQPVKTDICTVNFKTLEACKLGISAYPDFEYNAEGGRGTGTATKTKESDLSNEISVCFDLETLYIPPLTSRTTRFLGLPLPPFLKIDILPELFQGIIDQESGQVDLEFMAKFCFSVGDIYRAPPLLVKTKLTSEESKGTMRSGRGERLDGIGKCRLVGVATVDPIDDIFLNSFLRLPTECLANLNAVISFEKSS